MEHSKQPSPKIHGSGVDVADALKMLKEGNQRFAAGDVRHAHQAAEWRKHLTEGQHPFATILCCSDSRVPPELVFDQGLGDLFVIRVAGNIIDADVIGSIGYAIKHLSTRLVVVMGHEGCGAVTAALKAIEGESDDSKYINQLLHHITPGLKKLDPGLNAEKRLSVAVETNVRRSLSLLSQIPEASHAIEHRQFSLHGAVYELGTGRVRFLES